MATKIEQYSQPEDDFNTDVLDEEREYNNASYAEDKIVDLSFLDEDDLVGDIYLDSVINSIDDNLHYFGVDGDGNFESSFVD